MTCDLGLPGKTVYACLAETALLALEERYESFTLGRNIEIDKVKEIYKMAVRHGARLSAIRGHMGFISDKEIHLIRELAQKKRRKKTRPYSCCFQRGISLCRQKLYLKFSFSVVCRNSFSQKPVQFLGIRCAGLTPVL